MGFYQDEENNVYTGGSKWGYSGFNGLLGDGNKKEDGTEFPTEKKYYQLYKNETNSVTNIEGGILGDATKETNGWNGIYFSFVYSVGPVFVRGGSNGYAYQAKIFSFGQDAGLPNNRTFRVCLCIK